MRPYDHIRASLECGDAVVLGGPVGSELVRRGVRWRGHGMLTDADAVGAVYREYLAAGADVLRTNTFQLNRRIYRDVFRDEAHMRHIGAPGLERRAGDLTRRAVELARAARDDAGRPDAAIAGVLSPLEHCFRPDLAPDAETARPEHAELAGIMADAGVDLLLLESMNVLTEARAAADVARAIGEIQGVTLAEDVTGPYDVIVRAEAASVDELGRLVVAQVQAVPGITRTVTCPVVHI